MRASPARTGQSTVRSPQDNSHANKNRFSREGNTDVVQKHDNEDEHKSVMRDVG